MKKITLLLSNILLLSVLLSCNNKKYTEVVDVPLPEVEQKVAIMGVPDDVKANDGSFQLEKLPYSYNALAPNISASTMENHYSKHYLTYTNNLNKAIAGTPLENLTIEEVLAKLDTSIPDIKNNAGGYYNHSLYFKCMGPKAGGQPQDTLAGAITKKFGSFENFSSAFKDEAIWLWMGLANRGSFWKPSNYKLPKSRQSFDAKCTSSRETNPGFRPLGTRLLLGLPIQKKKLC